MASVLYRSDLPGMDLIHRGKVRDVYAIDEDRLLIVASDRLSAFDVVLPDPIPGKGELLTRLSNFWFARTAHIAPNHLTGDAVEPLLPAAADVDAYRRRTIVGKRLRILPVEAIARGYLIGSGWKDYQATGQVSGIALPDGLRLADKLPEPIFTPSTKAPIGEHDANIGFDDVVRTVGAELAEKMRAITLAVYRHAADYAATRGIIIADTKLEFGLDADDNLLIADEMLTPDSSRFWPADAYEPGRSPPSFDKQFVRDYLETLDWNKSAPGPRLPAVVIAGSVARYREALDRLTA